MGSKSKLRGQQKRFFLKWILSFLYCKRIKVCSTSNQQCFFSVRNFLPRWFNLHVCVEMGREKDGVIGQTTSVQTSTQMRPWSC